MLIDFEQLEEYDKTYTKKMNGTNDLMDFISVSLGTTQDEIYERLVVCNFPLEDPELAMFTISLLNAMGREGRGYHPTEVVLMLAFGESGSAERGRNKLMRWRRGKCRVTT